MFYLGVGLGRRRWGVILWFWESGSRGRIIFSSSGRRGKFWTRLKTMTMVFAFAAFFFMIFMVVMGVVPGWKFHELNYGWLSIDPFSGQKQRTQKFSIM